MLAFKRAIIASWFCGLISFTATALELPSNLTKSDFRELIGIFGLNTSGKLLSNPFPLGGYDGLEIGVGIEVIDTSGVSRLGDITQAERDRIAVQEVAYPRFSVGKGLYNNVDLFLNFTPKGNGDISDYGGLIRWNFYQAKFLPISSSFLFHGSLTNFKDVYNSSALGLDLLVGMNVDNFALYFGGGQMQVKAQLSSKVADSSLSINSRGVAEEIVRDVHSFVGVSLEYGAGFLALQIDRYQEPVYSAKLGLRL